VTGAITSAFVAQAQAEMQADHEDPALERLDRLSSQLDALQADVARLKRGSD
jgi:hypothetical protein